MTDADAGRAGSGDYIQRVRVFEEVFGCRGLQRQRALVSSSYVCPYSMDITTDTNIVEYVRSFHLPLDDDRSNDFHVRGPLLNEANVHTCQIPCPRFPYSRFSFSFGFMESMTTTTTTTATTTATEELSHHHATAARPDGEGGASASRSTGRSLEFTMRQYPSAKMKLDQFFLEWLSLPEYERLIGTVLDNAANNRSLKAGVEEAIRVDTLSSTASSMGQLTPPMSPKNLSSSKSTDEHTMSSIPSKINSETVLSDACSSPVPSKRILIPQFYFPEGSPAEKEIHTMKRERIRELFLPFHPMGMQQRDFLQVVQEVCDLPGMLAYPLFRRLTDGTTLLTQEVFESWWESERLATASAAARMIAILRRDTSVQWLSKEDLVPLLRAVVDYHPSLEFLSDHPEFQERYIETVSYRIFYVINKSRNGRISLRELKRSDLIDALFELDAEQDINKVLRYFSYEHFYVIYCKFWELDNDHDFLLERHDLIRYGCHCLTYQIVDKIFEVMVRPKLGGENGRMDYQEFVWFILSEEDKTTDASIDYWFRCIDLDGDGYLSAHDMRPFYEGQLERMESTSCEPVMFEDVICQLHDLIQPNTEGYFSIKVRDRSPIDAVDIHL